MSEYLNIDEYIRKDPYLKDIDKLFSITDFKCYGKNDERIAMNVAMFNYSLIRFSPVAPVLTIERGPMFKQALREGLIEELREGYMDEDDSTRYPHLRHMMYGLPKDNKQLREKCGLTGDGAVNGIMLFYEPQIMPAFNRQGGTYRGERFIADPLFKGRF